MVSGNIRRSEASQRSALLEVGSYLVDLDLSGAPVERGELTFRSTTEVRFRCARPGQESWIDLIGESLSRAWLNGVELPVATYDGARLPLPGLAAENTLVVEASCWYSTSGEGLHRFADPADSQTYLYTQFATAEARRVFACFEQPDLKAPLTLRVTAPAHWTVVGNSPTPGPIPSGPGTQLWEFAPTPPLATYVMAVVAGPYHEVRDSYRGAFGTYPLGLLCRAGMARHLDAPELFATTKAGLEFYESAFGSGYPFAKYDQVFVPEFNLGAMENPGAVTFREDAFLYRSRVTDAAHELRANVVLHEMAHMWFGDLVTMRWWDDLWLNESFAEWAGHHVAVSATQFTDSWVSFAISGKAWASRADQLPSTHPVATDMVDLEAVYLNFDGITYAKGAAVLKQLVAWVGLEAFYAGLRQYFAKHAWGSTTLVDLLEALGESSGRSLSQWAVSWLQTPGMNTLRTQVELDGAGRYRRVQMVQEPPRAPLGVPPTLRPHRVAMGAYNWTNSGSTRRLVRTQLAEFDLVGVAADVDQLAGQPAADLLLPNDGDLTFAKIRMDPASLAVGLESVSDLERPLARALVWGSVWDMVRDAELPTTSYLQMLQANLGREVKGGLVASVLATLPEALLSYTPSNLGEPAVVSVAASALAWARGAVPGSDLQLTFTKGFIRWARSPEQLQELAALLGHNVGIPGLDVDQDLRWSVVSRLVACGAAGPDLVAAEFARDPTMSGNRMATAARASQPDPGVKAAAWHAATTDETLTNSLLEATISGFAQPEHAALIEPYAATYFEQIGSLWARRSPNTAATLARGLFPSFVVSPEVLALARGFLAAAQPAGLARIVAEGADGLRRALLCRETFAAVPGTLEP